MNEGKWDACHDSLFAGYAKMVDTITYALKVRAGARETSKAMPDLFRKSGGVGVSGVKQRFELSRRSPLAARVTYLKGSGRWTIRCSQSRLPVSSIEMDTTVVLRTSRPDSSVSPVAKRQRKPHCCVPIPCHDMMSVTGAQPKQCRGYHDLLNQHDGSPPPNWG